MLSTVQCQETVASQPLQLLKLHTSLCIYGMNLTPALMQFDVYSCGEFDVEKICNKIKKDFDTKKIEYKFLNRETGLVDL